MPESLSPESVRQQLTERRAKLQHAMTHAGRNDRLTDLLREVDTALDKIAKGTYGLCETCHDPIEEERLAVDPLLRNCLDHLSPSEQRMLEHDLDLAFHVQSALLPKQGFSAFGWSTAYHYEPAGAVSGDYLDLIIPDGDRGSFIFLLGDVTGKGVAASILMSNLHAIFRSLARNGMSLPQLLSQANRLFCEGTTSRYFATIVVGRASMTGEVEVCNAGHPAPAIVRGNKISTIASTALPLGMFCHSDFVTTKIRLQQGESLAIYSDGLVEARNASDAFYGEEGLLSTLGTHGTLLPAQVVEKCIEGVNAFRGGSSRLDDLTLLILRRDL